MTGLKQRIFRRRAPGSPGRSAAGFAPRLKAGVSRLRPSGSGAGKGRPWGKGAARTPGIEGASRLPRAKRAAGRLPWGKKAARQPAPQPGPQPSTVVTTTVETSEVLDAAPGSASFRDRGRLRRRLRFLRRARELAFRDVGGLIFDMRRFDRDRPDLVEAKLAALGAVDRELRSLERVLDDRRPIHELREPGLSSCPRCGALHASEDNFCPRCGLQFGGAQAMGEVGGAIAAPPQAPPAPVGQPTSATLIAPGSGLDQASSQAAPAGGGTGLTADGHGAPGREATHPPGNSAGTEPQTEIFRPHDAP